MSQSDSQQQYQQHRANTPKRPQQHEQFPQLYRSGGSLPCGAECLRESIPPYGGGADVFDSAPDLAEVSSDSSFAGSADGEGAGPMIPPPAWYHPRRPARRRRDLPSVGIPPSEQIPSSKKITVKERPPSEEIPPSGETAALHKEASQEQQEASPERPPSGCPSGPPAAAEDDDGAPFVVCDAFGFSTWSAPPRPSYDRRVLLRHLVSASARCCSTVSLPVIRRVHYAHGGYAGAAPFILRDESWVKILMVLMPESAEAVGRLTGFKVESDRADDIRDMPCAGSGNLNMRRPPKSPSSYVSPDDLGWADYYQYVKYGPCSNGSLREVYYGPSNGSLREEKPFLNVPRGDTGDNPPDPPPPTGPAPPAGTADPTTLIRWADNNPVICAYGILREQREHAVRVEERRITRIRKERKKILQRSFTHGILPSLLRKRIAEGKKKVVESIEKVKVAHGMERSRSWDGSYGRSNSEESHLGGSSSLDSLVNGSKKSQTSFPPPPTSMPPPTIEWDVFLDPVTVSRVAETIGDNPNADVNKDLLDGYVIDLVSNMRIAHGTTGQLLSEALGISPHYNFQRFRHAKCGMRTGQWLDTFARALRYGRIIEGDPRVDIFECNLEGLESPLTSPQGDRGGRQIDLARNILVARGLLGAPLHVVLDLKSRRVPKQVWGQLVDVLRALGLRVDGVGSMTLDEIRDISRYSSQPVREMLFFHSAGDLQHACHAGKVRPYDTVYFNGGSLLWNARVQSVPGCCNWTEMMVVGDMALSEEVGGGAEVCSSMCNLYDCFGGGEEDESQAEKKGRRTKGTGRYYFQPFAKCREGFLTSISNEENLTAGSPPSDNKSSSTFKITTPKKTHRPPNSTVQDYMEHYHLRMGIYAQEFAIDEEALELLIRYVNSHPTVFTMGMAWGGLNGVTVRGIQPGMFRKTDGYWAQRYLGRSWERKVYPTDCVDFDNVEEFPDHVRLVSISSLR